MPLGLSTLSEAPLSDPGVIPLALAAYGRAGLRSQAAASGFTSVGGRALTGSRAAVSTSGSTPLLSLSLAASRAALTATGAASIVGRSTAGPTARMSLSREALLAGSGRAAPTGRAGIIGATSLTGGTWSAQRVAGVMSTIAQMVGRAPTSSRAVALATLVALLATRSLVATRAWINLRHKGAEPSSIAFDDATVPGIIGDDMTLPTDEVFDYSANSSVINDDMR